MIPKDLLHDVQFKYEDKGSFDEIYRFELSQIDARNDPEPARKPKGKDDMDVDELSQEAAGEVQPGDKGKDNENPECIPCGGKDFPSGDLFSMKGGKGAGGSFEGYCG